MDYQSLAINLSASLVMGIISAFCQYRMRNGLCARIEAITQQLQVHVVTPSSEDGYKQPERNVPYV